MVTDTHLLSFSSHLQGQFWIYKPGKQVGISLEYRRSKRRNWYNVYINHKNTLDNFPSIIKLTPYTYTMFTTCKILSTSFICFYTLWQPCKFSREKQGRQDNNHYSHFIQHFLSAIRGKTSVLHIEKSYNLLCIWKSKVSNCICTGKELLSI